MDFSLGWILLGLPLAFTLGWAASRFDLRQIRLENRDAPKAYFKGLNYLLNEQQDRAIDAFIEAVQNDPDTSELHFALGNLFRRRGEYERAVRVHEHLLSRGDLSQADRHRAQHALALDFLKAGLLDHAESALRKLEGTAFEQEARLALLANYERSRDWVLATEVASKLEQSAPGSFAPRLAHYLCEQATSATAQARNGDAHAFLQQAINQAPDAPRPRLDMARLQQAQGDLSAAQQTLLEALVHAPAAAPLLAEALADVSLQLGNTSDAFARLQALYEQSPSLDILAALVRLADGNTALSERDLYARHLAQEPSLVAATRWIAQEKLEHEQFHPQVQRALDHAVKPLLRYRCAACGFEATHHFWQCPGCQTWDSYPAKRVEEL
ncbi:MAG: lipopolysaccharide assembly protein LapB [Rhodoferax sp.]|nr:lipopolysaccharide assembly protein LapB [Rhodoferax sp.]OIP21266.1 MAG: lipopolysaccharide assembly protein LapB [Comamonadaceae bacterium CG2_30_60_41]PIW08209.1 MAG: lipopolysaccharide assembly protein LapB [Comamonadaceae bacterium CG17_big_fil_post_rev_8_21_14_2_50_60_13]PIY24574.1 MAG: lipopolysaccharide assembly protein LapB [Comamonadaceae bacterium CG_4_10_14_3_um_filter_60_75]PJC12733.1 MAG: lipopolysaccharide assembly protein LapB [Comamonadaceae bacterium CG_4_9_14_0_8_um_filter_